MTDESGSHMVGEIIAMVCDRHRDQSGISPDWIATEVMIEIGMTRDLHSISYSLSHLQVRQMARQFCRRNFEPLQRVDDDLFPDTLQSRYPRRRLPDNEPIYVPLAHLSAADVVFNLDRLRREAGAKLRHADNLERWAIAQGLDLSGDFDNDLEANTA